MGLRVKGITTRSMVGDEFPLIMDSWTKTFLRDSPRCLAPWLWARAHRNMIRELLDDEACVVVCELESVPGEVIGWACWTEPDEKYPCVLHYIFVKPMARRSGIASYLFNQVLGRADERGLKTSHTTRAGKCLLENLGHDHPRRPAEHEHRPPVVAPQE